MVSRITERYAHGNPRPLGGYAALLGMFGSGALAAGVSIRRAGPLPDRPGLGDVALLAAGTHMGSRLMAKDSVTSVLRAPFTRYEGPGADGEVEESVPGEGLSHAIGELLTCPFCLAVWFASALTFGMLLAPRATRWVAGALAAAGISDYLQYAYTMLQERA